MNILILPLLTLVVYGPTQFGKTTFIKRLGGAVVEKSKGAGRSVTTVPTIYNFNMTWPNDNSIQPISIIDLPGLDDTELALSNDFIGKSFQIWMSQKAIQKIDAILVFNSLGESSTRVKTTLNELTEALGDSTSSVVFVLSKADLAKYNPGIKETVIKDCELLGTQYLEWSDKADKAGVQMQLTNFRNAIAKVQSFEIHRFKDIDDQIQKRAEDMQSKDENRFSTYNISIPIPRITEHTVIENVTIAEKVARYNTSEALIAKAMELQKIGPKETVLVPVNKEIRLHKTELMPTGWSFLIISHHGSDTKATYETKVVQETEIKFVEKPLDFYIDLLKAETDVRLTNTTSTTKHFEVEHHEEQREIKVEKYTFEHYLDQAREEMMKEIWTKLKDRSNDIQD